MTVMELLDLEIDELGKQPPSIEKARAWAIIGLYIDGAHHKQWFLEQVIEALGGRGIGRISKTCERRPPMIVRRRVKREDRNALHGCHMG